MKLYRLIEETTFYFPTWDKDSSNMRNYNEEFVGIGIHKIGTYETEREAEIEKNKLEESRKSDSPLFSEVCKRYNRYIEEVVKS